MNPRTPRGELPAYDRPPVVEVALAVQFESEIGYRSLDLAAIAARWADTLPVVSERAPLGPMAVELESPPVAFKMSDEAETPRLWLQNEEGSRLLQLQQDRLVVNWRKRPEDTPYPHYRTIRGTLVEAWERLSSLISRLDLAIPAPSICEVLYVNRFEGEAGQDSPGDMTTFRCSLDWSHERRLP